MTEEERCQDRLFDTLLMRAAGFDEAHCALQEYDKAQGGAK